MTAAEANDPVLTRPHPAPGTWAEQAACRTEDPDLFFPPEEERGRYTVLRETLAKRICLGCPVLGECTSHALATDERYEVRGGLTPAERDRRAAAAPDVRHWGPGDDRAHARVQSGWKSHGSPKPVTYIPERDNQGVGRIVRIDSDGRTRPGASPTTSRWPLRAAPGQPGPLAIPAC